MLADNKHLTQALIHLDHLTHNVRLLGELVSGRPLWPAIKANAYGHGVEMVTPFSAFKACVALRSHATTRFA
jgi:alanine racemase